MQKLIASYQRWVENQDAEYLNANVTIQAWSVNTITIAVLLLLLTQIRVLKSFTGLSFLPAFLCFVPAAIFGFSASILKPEKSPLKHLVAWSLGSSSGIFFFCAALVALSKPQSKLIFASLFFFASLFYGQLHRVTWREPFLALGIPIAVPLALLLDSSPATLTTLSIMIVIGIFITVMTGTWQVDADLQKAEETRLRYAVLGQLHKEQATQLNKVNSALVELLGANHDLNNQIQTMIINVDMMRGAIQAKEPEEELLDMTSDIKIVARRIQSLAKEHRKDVEQEWDLKKELSHIRVGPSIEQALKAARLRYPDVDFQAELASPEVQVYVAKGEDTLFRALENVLLNACQGDGTQGAQKIELKVYKGPVGQTLLFEVLDDGPGFSEELLKPDLTPFETTKDEGTGLGLYTTEKWILASGGSLTRKNRPQGGAHVTIELPMWV